MRTIVMMWVMMCAACVVTPEDQPAEIAPISDNVSANPLRWMLGTWGCKAGYHAVPQARTQTRAAAATYTITEDAEGVVHGEYREKNAPTLQSPDFDDTWTIGTTPIDDSGNVSAFYTATLRDLSSISASGTLRGGNGSAVILGVDSFSGNLTFPGGATTNSSGHDVVGWHGSEIALVSPVEFVRNWLVQIGPGTFQDYMDLDCKLETPVATVARSVVDTDFCTISDQAAGFCTGPFTALAGQTRDEATANGATDVDAVTVDCIAGVAGQKFCSLAIDLPLCRLVVNCTKYADGNVECSAGCF